jgi:hypothetical protein
MIFCALALFAAAAVAAVAADEVGVAVVLVDELTAEVAMGYFLNSID